jgi:hypothetical protein
LGSLSLDDVLGLTVIAGNSLLPSLVAKPPLMLAALGTQCAEKMRSWRVNDGSQLPEPCVGVDFCGSGDATITGGCQDQ